MKNLKLIGFLMLIASSLVFIQCTTDPVAGPAGEDGVDGVDGVDGIDGVDGSAASCISCHSAEHKEPIYDSYIVSGHASGGSWARGTTQSCAQCHNNQGYIDYLSGNFATDGVQSVNPAGYTASSPITCTGCHSNHRSFDFENDGNDYAMRNINPVALVIDPTVTIDFRNDADPLGLSNSCTTCHQPRDSYPVPAGLEPIEITSFRYGPHHAPQATMLEGVMAANIPGPEGYPGVGSSTHVKGASCTSCHMGESANAEEGGHTWMPTQESCLTCHPSGAPSEASGYTENMATLKALLIDIGILAEDDYVVPGTYPGIQVQAVWNYRTLLEDKSKGIHNPNYTKALLTNSIAVLGIN